MFLRKGTLSYVSLHWPPPPFICSPFKSSGSLCRRVNKLNFSSFILDPSQGFILFSTENERSVYIRRSKVI